MTELRDARLREAMQQAPDAGARPTAGTREAIHAAAHAAVQPWWLRWRRRAGGRAAWPAAFATVLVAGVVTLLWQGQEVPGPVPVGPPATVPAAQVEAPAAAAPAVPASAAAAAPPVPPKRVPPPAPTAPATAASPRSAPAVVANSKVAADEARTAPPAMVGELARGRTEQAPQARAADAPLLEKSGQPAPAPEPLRDATAARAAPRAPVAAAQAPAPPAAPAAAPWSQVRVEAGAASIVLERAQAGELVRLLEQLLRAPSEPPSAGGAAALRFELGQGEEAIGVLELSGERWRWLPLRSGQQPRTLKPDAALAAELHKEAERVLRR